MDIEKAREMLADSRKKKCVHGSSYTCVHCEARVRAEVWLEGLDAERMFPAYILAVEALGGTDPWVAFGPSKGSSTPGVQCAYCDREFGLHEEPQHASDCPWVVALAAWEKL